MSKLKVTLTGFMFPLVLLFGSPRVDSRNPGTKNNHNGYAQSGTLQKMIVENASVTMQLDLNGLNGSNSLVARPVTLQFSVAANSFFPILVFNDLLRAARAGLDGLDPAKCSGTPCAIRCVSQAARSRKTSVESRFRSRRARQQDRFHLF